MRLPTMVLAVMAMVAASGAGYAMGGGGGGHGGGAGGGAGSGADGGGGGHGGGAGGGAGGGGGGDNGGGHGGFDMAEDHGATQEENGLAPAMNRDHDAALSARRAGRMEPLAIIAQRVRKQYGGKILDARLVRNVGGIYYEIRILDRRNRLLTLKVAPEARANKRMNFGVSARPAQ